MTVTDPRFGGPKVGKYVLENAGSSAAEQDLEDAEFGSTSTKIEDAINYVTAKLSHAPQRDELIDRLRRHRTSCGINLQGP